MEFYRDTNNNGQLDIGTDDLLALDTSPDRGWTWTGSTATFPIGANRFFARAQDEEGAWSAAASTTATVLGQTHGDTTPPAAALQRAGGPPYGATTFQFTVRYDDETAVDASSIDHNDIMVIDPNGFNHAATLITKTSTSDIATIFATYQMTAPGGAWDADDEGTYQVTIQPGEVTDTSDNAVPEITGGAFTVWFGDVDLTPPAASAQYVGSPIPATDHFDFLIRYADNVAVDASDFDSSDILIIGPYGWMQVAAFVGASSDTDAFTIDATYRITAPGGAWDIDDDGVYRIEVRSGAVSDTSGLFVAEGQIGTFVMDLANVDDVAPTATLLSVQHPADGDEAATLVVRYADDTAVDASMLGTGDLLVTGPGGFSQVAAFVQATSADDTSPIDATYSVAAPGGAWDGGDDGTYTVTIQPGEVADNSANPLPSGELGTFEVRLTNIQVLASWQSGGVTVTLVDVNGGADAGADDVVIRFGAGGRVTSITLGGQRSYDGVGIVISGATQVNNITDSRKGTRGDLAFIASSAPIKNITLKSGLTGCNLNGKTIGGLAFAADVDGDGNTRDLAAITSGGPVNNVNITGGDVGGDVVAAGKINNVNVKKDNKTGAGGTLAGDVRATGDINNVKADASILASARIAAGGKINGIQAGLSIGGAGHTITAGDKISQVQAKAGGIHSAITANGSKGTVIGNVHAKGGDVAGSVSAPNGSIGTVKAQRNTKSGAGGAVTASVQAGIKVSSVQADTSIGGDGHTITAGDAVSTVKSKAGDIHSTITANGARNAVGTVHAKGGDVKGSVSAPNGSVGTVKAQRDTRIGAGGAVSASIQAGVKVGSIQADTLIGGDGHTITAGQTISTVKAKAGHIISTITAYGSKGNAVGNVQAKGGDISGAVIAANGRIGTVKAQYDSRLGAGGTVNATITAKGNIATVQAQGVAGNAASGNITGAITSLAGKISTIKAQNGAIAATAPIVAGAGDIGSVQGDSIGGEGHRIEAGGRISSVQAKNGDVDSEIIARSNGPNAIANVKAKGGDVKGSIQAVAGGVGNVQADCDTKTLVGGNVGAVVSGHLKVGNVKAIGSAASAETGNVTGDISSAAGQIANVTAQNGDLTADIFAATRVGNIKAINGHIREITITAGDRVSSIQTSGSGDISGVRARIRGQLGSIKSARDIVGSMFSAAQAGAVRAARHVTQSLFAAGYDFGADFRIGGGDDTLASGTMGALSVGGDLIDTTVVAGVNPGINPLFGPGTGLAAGGKGKLGNVTVKGAIITTDTGFAFLADDNTFTVKDSSHQLKASSVGQTFPGTQYVVQVR